MSVLDRDSLSGVGSDWVDAAYRYLPYSIVGVLFSVMLWLRLLPYEIVVRASGVYYSGNDPWYHMRMVHLIVQHFPNTPLFDPWSYFPYGTGTHSGFGGLFDQLIALAALIMGLGDPSTHTVNVVGAVAPAVFGAVTVVPVFFLVSKLTDRWGGALAGIFLALFTGGFLRRTFVGSPDHQSAEAFFGTLAVMGVAYMVVVCYREKPTLAHVKDRDWGGLKKPVITSVLGGVAAASYLMMWPPGVMLVFVFGVFVVFQMIREHIAGKSTEYLAFGVTLTFVTVAVLTLLYSKQLSFSSTSFSLLQPFLAFAVAVGAVFLHKLSNYMSNEDMEKLYYPISVLTVILGVLAVMWVVYPRGIEMLQNLISRIYSLGYLTTTTARTVAEIAPATLGTAWSAFGVLFFVAVLGAAVMLYRLFESVSDHPLELLVVLWSYTMFSAYFTMVRFGYYVAVNVAVLSAFFVWWTITDLLELDREYVAGFVVVLSGVVVWWWTATEVLGLGSTMVLLAALGTLGVLALIWWAVTGSMEIDSLVPERLEGLEGYQVIVLFLVLFLVIPGNVVGMRAGSLGGSNPVWHEAANAPVGANMPWQNSLGWLNENTPDEPLDYDRLYSEPEDGDFDYPVDESPIQGAYGVMSWWDYGHWITYTGQRVPNANPFQEGPVTSAAYFTSTDEERSELILESLPSIRERSNDIYRMSQEELRDVVENQDRQERFEDTRYVMVDDQMAAGKFGAIVTWVEEDLSTDYLSNQEFSVGNRSTNLPGLNERYFDTMLSRLYYDDAAGLEHYRLVHESERYSLLASSVNLESGRFRVNRLFSRTGYDGNVPGTELPIQQVNQLPETQTIPAGPGTYVYDLRSAASVKTFERVEGARLTGTARNSSNVTAALRLNTTNTNRGFLYFQRVETGPGGEFEVTVPYPTEDTVSLEDGGTNASLRAVGNYSVYAGPVSIISFRGRQTIAGEPDEVGQVDVSEDEVYFGEEVRVEMEPYQQDGNTSDAGNSTSGG